MDKTFPVSGFGSMAVHGGHKQDPTYAHQVPIYASSTYVYDTAEQGMRRFSGKEEGYIYSRWGNPTMTEAAEKITALETFGVNEKGRNAVAAKGILHASGMAAISTLMLATLKPGDKILTHFSLYGGTDELIQKILPSLNITAEIIDLRDLNKAETAMKAGGFKLLYLETPANPTIQCVDLEELCKLAKKYKLIAFQNVNEALDETESKAWQRLLSVMTHEIMNSVAPISSIRSVDGICLSPKQKP